MPPLVDTGDFVIINSQLHREFDHFKQEAVEERTSYLRMNSLLQQYISVHPALQQSTTSKYGLTYLRLQSSQVDNLCRWVLTKREIPMPNNPVLGKKTIMLKLFSYTCKHVNLYSLDMYIYTGEINYIASCRYLQ